MFLANPAKYAPALGGDCTVCLAAGKGRVPGSVQHAAIYKDRLFLFPSADIKSKFRNNVMQYEKTDLAMDGMCTVCKMDMGKEVPGDPRFTVVHKGMRYQFPGAEQRDTFLSNPAKYAADGSMTK